MNMASVLKVLKDFEDFDGPTKPSIKLESDNRGRHHLEEILENHFSLAMILLKVYV